MTLTDADLRRFVSVQELPEGLRYRVGSGCKRAGQCGVAIATIGLKRSAGYEVVMQLDNGSIESFRPMQLFPIEGDGGWR